MFFVLDGRLQVLAGEEVVTFNHRVGVEGHASLTGAPDNRALLDQRAALRRGLVAHTPAPPYERTHTTRVFDAPGGIAPYPEEASRRLWAGRPIPVLDLAEVP
ncbi:hypothetical protein [Actinocorallia libanotica]|uniref:Cyclic nucleotide-binding domain-containing protein n=1 Tax=Actinocorallia libanotica TaxID=46162 RepID=A0ABP4BTI5_9ACTN